MNLNKLIADLQKLQAEGHGDKTVFYRHSSSGDCGEVWGGYVSDEVSECGPFEIEEGAEYVALSVGGN